MDTFRTRWTLLTQEGDVFDSGFSHIFFDLHFVFDSRLERPRGHRKMHFLIQNAKLLYLTQMYTLHKFEGEGFVETGTSNFLFSASASTFCLCRCFCLCFASESASESASALPLDLPPNLLLNLLLNLPLNLPLNLHLNLPLNLPLNQLCF